MPLLYPAETDPNRPHSKPKTTPDHLLKDNRQHPTHGYPPNKPPPPRGPTRGNEHEKSGMRPPVERSDPPRHPLPPRCPDPWAANRTEPANFAGALQLVQKFHDQQKLALGWSIAEATLVYWAITSPELRETLGSVGMSDDKYAVAVTRLFRQGLFGPVNQTDRNEPPER